MDEVRDRYGVPPTALLNLADYARIRVLADQLGLETLDREGSAVVLKFREKKTTVDPLRLIKMVRERHDLKLFPPATLKLDLSAPAGSAGPAGTGGPVGEGMAQGRGGGAPAASASRPGGRRGPRPGR